MPGPKRDGAPTPARRRTAAIALATCLLALAAAAPAARAWRELPPYDVPGGGLAQCLRAVGPGRLLLLDRHRRPTATTELLDVADGVAPRAATTLGHLDSCAEGAAAPGAAPLLGAAVDRHGKHTVMAMRVAAAGGFPTTLRATTGRYLSAPSVAIAPNGAAVVAWSESSTSDNVSGSLVIAAMRAPGVGRFGVPVVLDRDGSDSSDPVAGIDAAGDATVAWMGNQSSNDNFGDSLATAAAATAPAGGSFGALQQLVRSSGDAIALAVAPNGRALLAADAGDLTGAWERPSASAPFAPVRLPDTSSPNQLAVALAPDGGAVLAVAADDLVATVRLPGGRFGPARTLEGGSDPFGSSFSDYSPEPPPPSDDRAGDVAAAIGAAGDVEVSWIDSASGNRADTADVAHGTLVSGLGRRARLGTPCRSASAATPLTLRDGRLGVAWIDAARVASDHGAEEPRGGGRLHIATPDAAVPDPHALPPALSALVLGPQALHVGEALHVRVRCRRGPCDVRAVATSFRVAQPQFGGPRLVAASTMVGAGRSATLELSPAAGRTFARGRRPAPTAVTLIACGPAGAVAAPLTLRPRLRRLPPPPLPRVLDVRARRHGNAIHVTWRTSFPAREVGFQVWSEPLGDQSDFAQRDGRGHIHFSVTLRPGDPARVRRVAVEIQSNEQDVSRTTTVRVR
jgi:hypothetical protein